MALYDDEMKKCETKYADASQAYEKAAECYKRNSPIEAQKYEAEAKKCESEAEGYYKNAKAELQKLGNEGNAHLDKADDAYRKGNKKLGDAERQKGLEKINEYDKKYSEFKRREDNASLNSRCCRVNTENEKHGWNNRIHQEQNNGYNR